MKNNYDFQWKIDQCQCYATHQILIQEYFNYLQFFLLIIHLLIQHNDILLMQPTMLLRKMF